MFSRFAAFATLATLASAQIDLGGLLSLNLDPSILNNGNTLVNINAIANILDPTECAGSVIGLSINLLIPGIAAVCTCVNALGAILPGFIAYAPCAACPDPNSTGICATDTCGCACLPGFFADALTNTCISVVACTVLGNVVVDVFGTGQSLCQLAPSPLARSRAKKSLIGSETDLCPTSETACPLPSGGYECLDITSSLDSCGGCLGHGGVNCLGIPGALGVSCVESQCVISSCFPGWSFQNGACVRV